MKKFKSVSWAILEPCNMKCKFCFATFNDIKGIENLNAMTYENGCKLIDEIVKFGITKLTFYGGEPTLVKHLGLWIDYAKMIGLTTMLVTNGTRITKKYITENLQNLDWIVLSIDSLNEETNLKIGRSSKDGAITVNQYKELITMFSKAGKRIKINTVVSKYNQKENLTEFIKFAKPERWKILQVYYVKGQNDEHFGDMSITEDEFKCFLRRNSYKMPTEIDIVPEFTEDLDNSYLMIDPKGRFFQSFGGHKYSEEITKVGIEIAYNQITKDFDTYLNRKGIYNWI